MIKPTKVVVNKFRNNVSCARVSRFTQSYHKTVCSSPVRSTKRTQVCCCWGCKPVRIECGAHTNIYLRIPNVVPYLGLYGSSNPRLSLTIVSLSLSLLDPPSPQSWSLSFGYVPVDLSRSQNREHDDRRWRCSQIIPFANFFGFFIKNPKFSEWNDLDL